MFFHLTKDHERAKGTLYGKPFGKKDNEMFSWETAFKILVDVSQLYGNQNS